MKLNIDALHKVPEILELRGSYGRQFGKTTYAIYQIIGQLKALENSTIMILIQNDDRLDSFLDSLNKILKEESINFFEKELPSEYKLPSNYHSRRYIFPNNSNELKVLTLNTIQKNHPTSFMTKPEDEKNILITDLEEMPSEFYKETITIGNCDEILNKYKQFIKI